MIQNTMVFSLFLIFTGAAVLSTLALWTRQSLMVAYIALGMLLGPWGLRLVNDAYVIHEISDVGIVFLLFLLGLHLQPSHLFKMIRKVTSVGMISAGLFFIFGYVIGYLWHFSHIESLIIGASMMFSSTIIGLKLMPAQILHHRPIGEMMIGILLFQDLLAIIVLLSLSIATIDDFGFLSVSKVILSLPILMCLTFYFERYVLLVLFKKFGNVREYIFLLAIAWCLSVSELSAYFGLSHEVGAFIAGVSIADDSIGLYLAECLQPVRDFFLILFFFSVGANFNFDYLMNILLPATILAIGLLVAKPWVFKALVERVGEHADMGWELGSRLGQISEFSLLVAYVASEASLISSQVSFLIQASTILTFFVSSYWVVMHYQTPLSDEVDDEDDPLAA